ncbi:MAG: hypothetical protein M3512_06105 [Bacteroidota bacterium]|nr:hypothetical protein [Bacteroidota bacterium]
MKIILRIQLLVLLLFFSTVFKIYGQCELKFDSWVDQVEKSEVGDIYISLKGDPGTYTFRLYNLKQNKFIKEQVLNHLKVNEKVLLFENIPASPYIIYVKRDGCEDETALGGMVGLIIKRNN